MKQKEMELIKNYITAYNEFDVSSMLKNLHQNIQFKTIHKGKVVLVTDGIEDFEQQAKLATQYFTKRNQQIVAWQYVNDVLVLQIKYEATLAKDLADGFMKGDKIIIKGTSEFKFLDERIVDIVENS